MIEYWQISYPLAGIWFLCMIVFCLVVHRMGPDKG